MAIYQNTIANLGVRLEITHASPDIANNRTTITYKASIFKTGSHNPYNLLSGTPMYLTINGQSLHSTATGNYDLRGGTYQQAIKTGTLVIPHDADGSKSFTFSWNVNFTSTGYGYGNVTTSGTYVIPDIARASTFTIPSTTITTGSAFTVTIARASGSFTHKVSYIVGSSEVVWTSSAATSYAATVPHSLFNSHTSTASVSGVIRVTTMNGSVEVGSNQRSVTINLNSTAIPTVGSLSESNSNTSVFNSTNQYLRGISRLTATAGSVSGSYSSTIASYEFRVVRENGTTIFGATSKTTSSHQFSAFDFPNSGSETATAQVRVRDSRGRYSAWRAAPLIRVHYYAPPSIGTMTVRRVGSGDTTLQVTRNYSITLLYEGGSGSNLNTASLWFQHRAKGTTGATNNTGAKSTTTSLSNSNANLSGTFAAGTSYEVRAILDDGVAGRVIGSWISVGTIFVPMDIGPKGVGVGKIHSDGARNLEVGAGGISSEGPFVLNSHMVLSKHIAGRVDIRGTAGNSPLIVRGIDGTSGNTGEPDGDLYLNYISKGEVFIAGSKAWHQGNDGSGSGLDADVLDGLHASDIQVSQMDNSNGYSLRFPNGVQIIGGKKTFAAVSNPSIVFPQSFAATPNVSLTIEQSNRWLRVMTSVTTLSNSGLTASVIDFDAGVVANYTLHYYCIGRWKVTT